MIKKNFLYPLGRLYGLKQGFVQVDNVGWEVSTATKSTRTILGLSSETEVDLDVKD